jgi:hypothetical protein
LAIVLAIPTYSVISTTISNSAAMTVVGSDRPKVYRNGAAAWGFFPAFLAIRWGGGA